MGRRSLYRAITCCKGFMASQSRVFHDHYAPEPWPLLHGVWPILGGNWNDPTFSRFFAAMIVTVGYGIRCERRRRSGISRWADRFGLLETSPLKIVANIFIEPRVIPFERQQIISLPFNDKAGYLLLRVEGIHRHNAAPDIQQRQQRWDSLNFVALAVHCLLTQYQTVAIGPSRNEMKRLLQALRTYGGDPATMCGLELILLTFVRTIELRAARWAEIDFKNAEWRIPADRMKMREVHIVPLSRQAVGILKSLWAMNGHREYLFPNKRDHKRYITATTLNRALERMGFLGEGSIGFSAHGFRATASTILNEAGFRSDVIERQLAHQERNNVRAAYNHAQYMDERCVMMQCWADMVDDIGKDTPNTALNFVKALTFQAAE